MGKFVDMIGYEFNGCKVIRQAHKDKTSKWYWECQCFCGEKFLTLGTTIRKGEVKSCGCYRRGILKKQRDENKTHGDSKSRLFRIWSNMKNRCNNDKDKQKYKNYGGRGIKVCDEWNNNYDNFKKWALNNDYKEFLSIDRIDNDGDYEPSNCRWTDMKTQSRNKRNNINVFYKGKYRTISEIAEIEKCSKYKLYYRLKHNIPLLDEKTKEDTNDTIPN